ncbi:MAG: hypothetical protein ABW007_19510 [Chitinophagaceae bacterium]
MPKEDAREFELQSLQETRKQVTDVYGNRTLVSGSAVEKFTVIPTGIFIMDMALLGGVCESTGNCFFGWESSSKTTNCLRVAGQAQKKYPTKKVGWIDLDPMGFQQEWAMAQGCDPARVEIARPEHGEAAVDLADVLARTSDICMIITDGIAGFTSYKYLDESADRDQVSYIAKNVGKYCSKMRIAMSERSKLRNKLTILSTNQWRYKMVLMGDNRTLPGGTQSNFFHQVMLEFTAKPFNTAKPSDKSPALVDAYEGTFKTKKVKGASGIREGSYTMITDPAHKLGYGAVDEAETIAAWARKTGVIEGRGNKLVVPLYEELNFTSVADLIVRIREDDDFNLFMQQATVSKWRATKGLSPFPEDNYLSGATKHKYLGGSGFATVAKTISPPPPVVVNSPAAPVKRVPLKLPIKRPS